MSEMTSLETALMVSGITKYQVFPANQQKKPCVKDPFGKATRDEEQVRQLFGSFPNAMTAIPTGPKNGITVVDLDVKGGVDGINNFQNLVQDIPRTMVIRTPSGGLHLYFATGSDSLPSSAGKLGPGIDIRGAGAYAIGFGSVAQTGMYRWNHSISGFTWRPAPMPATLKQLIYASAHPGQARTGKGRPHSDVRNRLNSPIATGQRNNELTSRIGYLLKNHPPEQVHALAHHMNNTLTSEPVDSKEVDAIFCSILKRELQK